MKKSIFLIIVFFIVIRWNLTAQNKLYFVKDSVLDYSESPKARFFRTDTFDLTQLADVTFDLIKINKSDSINRFYIHFYIRNNTDSSVRLMWFTTNAGDNVPSWPNEPFKSNKIQCYQILQGWLRTRSNRYGSLEWEYFDKKERRLLPKTAVLAYKYELSD